MYVRTYIEYIQAMCLAPALGFPHWCAINCFMCNGTKNKHKIRVKHMERFVINFPKKKKKTKV